MQLQEGAALIWKGSSLQPSTFSDETENGFSASCDALGEFPAFLFSRWDLQSSQLFQQHQALKIHFLTLGQPPSLPGFNFLLLAGKNPPSEDHTLSQAVISIQDMWMCEETQAEQGKAAGMQGSVLGTHSLPATSCSF